MNPDLVWLLVTHTHTLISTHPNSNYPLPCLCPPAAFFPSFLVRAFRKLSPVAADSSSVAVSTQRACSQIYSQLDPGLCCFLQNLAWPEMTS